MIEKLQQSLNELYLSPHIQNFNYIQVQRDITHLFSVGFRATRPKSQTWL